MSGMCQGVLMSVLNRTGGKWSMGLAKLLSNFMGIAVSINSYEWLAISIFCKAILES